MKIVLNRCFGGFGLSEKACEWLIENRGYKVGEWKTGNFPEGVHLIKNVLWEKGYHINESAVIGAGPKEHVFSDNIRFRTHKDIVDVVEALGKKANGRCAELEVIDIPESSVNNGEITEYDGSERFEEFHASW